MSVGSRIVLAASLAFAAPALAGSNDACSSSARVQYGACKHAVSDDFGIARAVCFNEPDAATRRQCLADASSERADAADECREIRAARKEICEALGPAPHAPDMSPAGFEDPRNPLHPNPWFPLPIGGSWTYSDGSDSNTVTVLDKTKRIAGIDCLVVEDVENAGSGAVEQTFDWFATRTNADIVYCGEDTRELQTFPGDDPMELELVSREGSFKAGVDGAKAGTLFLGSPTVGATVRQEWAPSEAEDIGEVLSTTYRFGQSADLDTAVPAALAQLLCAAGDCVVIEETTPIEPDALERKYYARGVGMFLEVDLEETPSARPLVACNVDARCAQLPTP